MKLSKYNLVINTKNNDHNILFNTFNGNCLMVESNVLDKIKRNDINSFSKDDMDLFTKTGILIPNEVDENKIYLYMHNIEKFNSNHFSATVLLTEACNLRCTYCFQEHDTSPITMDMINAEKFIKFVTLSVKSKGSKSVSIVLFGGEPLINIDVGFHILNKIKKFCDENNIAFYSSIISNGTLLTEEIINHLLDYNCQSIQITLDGIKSIHDSRRIGINGEGSFDKIINALNLLKSNGKLHTIIRVNVDKTNLIYTHQLLENLGKKGYDFTNFTVDFGIVRGGTSACASYSSKCFTENEIGEVLYDLWNYAETQGFKYNIKPMRKTMYCGLYSNNQFTITPNCDVYKCWEHVGQKEHLMGKIDEDGNLSYISYALYDWMSVNPLNIEECNKCIYLPVCGGGCGVISYNESKTYHSKGCFKIKGTIEKQVLKYVENVTGLSSDCLCITNSYEENL